MIKDRGYLNLRKHDAIGLLKSAISAGRLVARDDGKFHVNLKFSHLLPWVFIKHCTGMSCYIWHHIYFDHCGFIPKPCFSCWKIVVRPANIKSAYKVLDIMRELDYPGKVGWEDRKTVFGNFGAYFYNRSLDEAKEKYPTICDAMKDVELQTDPCNQKKIPIIIKRGCTEFEHKFGPSDKWEYTAEDKENLLNSVIVDDLVIHTQTDWHIANTMTLWTHNAYSAGDPTVCEFTDGKPLFPKYITYQGEQNG